MHLNIRLNENYEDLLILLNELKGKQDILVLTKTWEVPNIELYYIGRYNAYFSRKGMSKSDRTIIYIY